ncbi:MAG: VWA domain-containing protein [Pyrinomonadaceae bacterium]
MALVFLSAPSFAQSASPTPTPQEVENGDVISGSDALLLSVPVFVTDQKGRQATGLTAADLVVIDNGRVRDIAFFGAQARPVDIVFALDDSGSIRDVIAQQQATALDLLRRFDQPSQMALIRFSQESRLAVPFTGELKLLRSEFARSAAGQTRTAIFDAALVAVKAFGDLKSNSAERRRLVILLSDGLDTASTVKPRDVIAAAREAGVSFYVIHLPLYTVRGNSLVTRPVAKGFKDLATQTGGLYLAGPNARAALSGPSAIDLAPVFQSIANDINGRYDLAYYLDPSTDVKGTHHLEVRCIAKTCRDLLLRIMRPDFIWDGNVQPNGSSITP